MSEPIHETLRRLFDVIAKEAAHNPALAQQLADIIGDRLGPSASPERRDRRAAFDAANLHAVNILRLHGEPALRGRLEQVKSIEDLRCVARASGLVLSAGTDRARATRAELIAGIIEAARHYDAQRSAAAL
jgi:hypothetical protein